MDAESYDVRVGHLTRGEDGVAHLTQLGAYKLPVLIAADMLLAGAPQLHPVTEGLLFVGAQVMPSGEWYECRVYNGQRLVWVNGVAL